MLCHICGSARIKMYYKNQVLILYRCAHCNLKFQFPLPDVSSLLRVNSPDYYKAYYQEQFDSETRLLFLERIKEFENLLGKRGSILDIGPGRGIFIQAAKESGWDCAAIDLSPETARLVSVILGKKVLVGDMVSKTEFPDNFFDVIHASHVLEHGRSPYLMLKEIWRVLGKNGIFYCEVPRQNKFMNFLASALGMGKFNLHFDPSHLFIFDFKNMRLLLESAGFKIITITVNGIGDLHRFVRGVHYKSPFEHAIKIIARYCRFEQRMGCGNLVVISQKQ